MSNRPYDVLPQFTSKAGRSTLKDFIPVPEICAVGRLDRDSKGLLVLTNDNALQTQLAQPGKRIGEAYHVQVEGEPTAETLGALRNGVTLNGGSTLSAGTRIVEEPVWPWPRNPPVQKRKNIPTDWSKVTLYEDRNHQVRRMAAHTGFPTLHLIRYTMGDYTLESLVNGE